MSCEYGKENREMIKEINKGILDIRNHYSQRLPVWASVLFTIMGVAIGSLIRGL